LPWGDCSKAASMPLKQGIFYEIKGAISFIAAQSCVDGVILFNRNRVAKGFGVVLRAKKITFKNLCCPFCDGNPEIPGGA